MAPYLYCTLPSLLPLHPGSLKCFSTHHLVCCCQLSLKNMKVIQLYCDPRFDQMLLCNSDATVLSRSFLALNIITCNFATTNVCTCICRLCRNHHTEEYYIATFNKLFFKINFRMLKVYA